MYSGGISRMNLNGHQPTSSAAGLGSCNTYTGCITVFVPSTRFVEREVSNNIRTDHIPPGKRAPWCSKIIMHDTFERPDRVHHRCQQYARDGKHIPDSKDMKALWENENGFVFFNHFVGLSDSPSEETINKAYVRGAALFPHLGFNGCDRISYFVVQVMNRRDDSIVRE
ncbi:hypothetical protein VTN77DRAFT_7747 [Rasamsonia byssochlamydoides]|uniref:uncharacterized protein n=1 Tax=Rasamsonia byssochlamydoides TaxID=89139 RepID=UPI003743326F